MVPFQVTAVKLGLLSYLELFDLGIYQVSLETPTFI